MCRFDRSGDLYGNGGDFGDGQRTLADAPGEGCTHDVFHRDEDVGGFKFLDIVDDTDAGMVESGSGPRFRKQPGSFELILGERRGEETSVRQVFPA